MTNRIKTVQNPRLILLACENSARLADIISDILNYCSYNTCIDDFSQNTDFIIENGSCKQECPENVIEDTVLFDDKSELTKEALSSFRERVAKYEDAMEMFGEESDKVITFSSENYGADVACRNYSKNSGTASFGLVGNGILSRVNIIDGKYTVDEILACTGVLLATGMPLASILGFFDYEE